MSNRLKLVEKMSALFGSTKKDSDTFLIDFVDLLRLQLATEGEVVLPGLGRIKAVIKPERAARNPKTGEAITVPAKTVLKFKAFPKALVFDSVEAAPVAEDGNGTE